MQTMDDSLFALVQAGRLDPREAYRKAADKPRFESLVPQE
jgi:Tfp pilus assembly ATPase PilU